MKPLSGKDLEAGVPEEILRVCRGDLELASRVYKRLLEDETHIRRLLSEELIQEYGLGNVVAIEPVEQENLRLQRELNEKKSKILELEEEINRLKSLVEEYRCRHEPQPKVEAIGPPPDKIKPLRGSWRTEPSERIKYKMRRQGGYNLLLSRIGQPIPLERLKEMLAKYNPQVRGNKLFYTHGATHYLVTEEGYIQVADPQHEVLDTNRYVVTLLGELVSNIRRAIAEETRNSKGSFLEATG
ncbi:MAG: hypothetical protein DRO11_02285 [Methanobacteriota archaeon]|nr:MAG: hypothetical protein DRO11_02285 [Euryarchaeota archaeon]